MINSAKDAYNEWANKFGLPEYFSSLEELSAVDNELSILKDEQKQVEYEIANRDEKNMNEFKIDRAIELHFLIEEGQRYLSECEEEVALVEKDLQEDYDRYSDLYEQDNLFPRSFREFE